MNTQFHIRPRFVLVLAVILLVAAVLTSCGTATPTPAPTRTPLPSLTPTQRATATPEPEADEPTETDDGLLMPSPTLGPTATPGVITDLISEFTETVGLEQKTVFWVDVESWLNLGASILLAIVIGFLLSKVVYYALERAVERTPTTYDDEFLKIIGSQITWIFIVVGIQVGTMRLPFIEVMVKQWLNQLYIAAYVVSATIIVWRLIDAVVEWYQADVEPKRDTHQVDTLLILLHRIARVILLVISTIMLLSLYNINVNVLIASLGVGGLAISLAAQDSLSNVISGVMIMIDQPFRVGDRIEIRGLGTWGDVVDIGLRSTRIRTRDNRLVIIPNMSISTDQVVNYTYPDPQYRIQIEIGIGYGQEIETVRQLIIDTVRQVPGVLQDKPVDALYVEMGASAMTFRVRWWLESFVDTRRMFDAVNTALQNALDEAGVEMPFNTMDINIMNVPDSAGSEPAEER